MTPKDLRAWRERLGLNVGQAARLLGADPDAYERYESDCFSRNIGLFPNQIPGYISAAAYGATIAVGQARRVLDDCGFKPKDISAKWFRQKVAVQDVETALANKILRDHAIPRGHYPPGFHQAPIIIGDHVLEFSPQDLAGLVACPSAKP